MPISAKNLIRHELINLKIRIKDSTDPTQKGLKGKIIDETYNTFKLETKKGEKVVPKRNCIFIFALPNKQKVQVEGHLLVGRPEDRIKKKFPRW